MPEKIIPHIKDRDIERKEEEEERENSIWDQITKI